MMKNIFRAGALLLALSLAPLVPVNAQGHGHGHAYAYGRRRHNRRTTMTHWRDRNLTPGGPRGSLSGMTPPTFPTSEGRGLGRSIRRGNEGARGRRGHGKH
jgi:hypothetical protein